MNCQDAMKLLTLKYIIRLTEPVPVILQRLIFTNTKTEAAPTVLKNFTASFLCTSL